MTLSLECKQLYYFKIVADSGSLSTAAEKLFLTQPALSKAVQKLEEELSCRLFNRSVRGITLTEHGKFLYDQFEPVLDRYEKMTSNLKDYFKINKGTLTLSIGQGVFRILDPNLLLDFFMDYPGIKMKRFEQTDDECYRYVLEGKSDISIAVKPNDLSKLDFIPVKKEPLYLFVNKSNPLSKRGQVSICDLKDEPFLVFDSRFSFRETLVRECRKCGYEPNIILSSGEVEMLIRLVIENHGIFVCVEHVAKTMKSSKISIIPITDDLEWEIGFVYRKGEILTYESRKFIHYILKDD